MWEEEGVPWRQFVAIEVFARLALVALRLESVAPSGVNSHLVDIPVPSSIKYRMPRSLAPFNSRASPYHLVWRVQPSRVRWLSISVHQAESVVVPYPYLA